MKNLIKNMRKGKAYGSVKRIWIQFLVHTLCSVPKSRIQSKYGKIRTRENSVFGHFSRIESPAFYRYMLIAESSIFCVIKFPWCGLVAFVQLMIYMVVCINCYRLLKALLKAFILMSE